jgi:HemK-like putative methylase
MSAESEAALREGRIQFMGLELRVSPGVLVPRKETELLAKSAISRLQEGMRAADVCCGSGNLACAMAAHTKAEVFASDLTDECVALARSNVAALNLNVKVFQGDLLQPLAEFAPFDLIVCNPPYISTGKLAERADLADEPREAFDGGPYGLSIHQRVIKDALPLLKEKGHLLFEFGVGQARQLELLFKRARGYDSVTMISDDSGEPRVAVAMRGQ